MSDEYVLVPKVATERMLDASWEQSGESWLMRQRCHERAQRHHNIMLAARPPIPRAVWDAMVERGAEASADFEYGKNTFASWKEGGNHNALANWRLRANRTLFAALNNPKVADE